MRRVLLSVFVVMLSFVVPVHTSFAQGSSSCDTQRFTGDNEGTWGNLQNSTRFYTAESQIFFVDRSSSDANGLVLVVNGGVSSVVATLTAIDQFYTIPADGFYRAGFVSTTNNVPAEWVDLFICDFTAWTPTPTTPPTVTPLPTETPIPPTATATNTPTASPTLTPVPTSVTEVPTTDPPFLYTYYYPYVGSISNNDAGSHSNARTWHTRAYCAIQSPIAFARYISWGDHGWPSCWSGAASSVLRSCDAISL